MPHDEGVAVGRRLGGDRCAKSHAGARAVIDDDLLPPSIGEFLSDQACIQIDTSAPCSRRRDETDRVNGINPRFRGKDSLARHEEWRCQCKREAAGTAIQICVCHNTTGKRQSSTSVTGMP